MKTLAVLAYHKIGKPPDDGWETWNYVPEEIFKNQLKYLQNNGWVVVDEKQFLNGLHDRTTVPAKAVLITFDDGYQSNLKIAAPILQSFSYPAIVFVPTGYVGAYNAFDADIFYEPKEPICSWEELKQLEKARISIQAHSVSHSHFSEISVAQLHEEISHCKETLEENLAKKIELFSFPYGDNGLDINLTDNLLKRTGYKAAFMFAGKPVHGNIENNFRIPRVAVGPDTNLQSVLEVY